MLSNDFKKHCLRCKHHFKDSNPLNTHHFCGYSVDFDTNNLPYEEKVYTDNLFWIEVKRRKEDVPIKEEEECPLRLEYVIGKQKC